MSDATTPTGPLSQKVLEFAEIIERTVPPPRMPRSRVRRGRHSQASSPPMNSSGSVSGAR